MKANRFLLVFLPLMLAACSQMPVTAQNHGGRDTEVLDSVNPKAKIHTELAAQYYARRQYSVALEELRQALNADSNYAPAYNMLGLLHDALLEYKEADDSFKHAISLAPMYSEAHNNYGYFLCSRKRYEEALAQFELAWKNPLYATPEMALGNASMCALRMGKQDEAENYARRALIRDPNQSTALLTLAEVQFHHGNIPMARSLINQADSQERLGASGLWLAIRVERQSGNREAAAEYAARLRREFPNSDETGWLLAGQFDKQEGRE